MNKRSMLETALAGATVLAALLAVPSQALAQESGAEIWARTCGRCHRMQPPNKYDARHWEAIVGHMALNARMSAEEEDAVREFLMGTARRVATENPDEGPVEVARLAALDPGIVAALTDSANGKEIFQAQCAPCHGDGGKGDGAGAIAFDPKPSDLTDADRMGELTDDELMAILKEGRGGMPGFSAIIEQEELEAVLRYVRSLTADEDGR